MFRHGCLVMSLVAAFAVTGCEEEETAPQAAQSDPVARPLGVVITGKGSVRSKSVGIDCSVEDTGAQTSDCSVRTTTDDVKLLATPAAGWTLDHWEVRRGEKNAFVVSPASGAELHLTGVAQVSSTTVDAVFVLDKPFAANVIAPTYGMFGTKVTITGNRLGGAHAHVSFAGKPAEVLAESSDSELHVLVPAGATSGTVLVENGVNHSDKLSFKVGVGAASWKVTWPADRVCFDVNDGMPTALGALAIANEPSPALPGDANVAGFSMLFLINTVHGDTDNTTSTLTGTISDDGSFRVTASPVPSVSYEATGTLETNGSASGFITVRVSQGDFSCVESGAFTINK